MSVPSDGDLSAGEDTDMSFLDTADDPEPIGGLETPQMTPDIEMTAINTPGSAPNELGSPSTPPPTGEQLSKAPPTQTIATEDVLLPDYETLTMPATPMVDRAPEMVPGTPATPVMVEEGEEPMPETQRGGGGVERPDSPDAPRKSTPGHVPDETSETGSDDDDDAALFGSWGERLPETRPQPSSSPAPAPEPAPAGPPVDRGVGPSDDEEEDGAGPGKRKAGGRRVRIETVPDPLKSRMVVTDKVWTTLDSRGRVNGFKVRSRTHNINEGTQTGTVVPAVARVDVGDGGRMTMHVRRSLAWIMVIEGVTGDMTLRQLVDLLNARGFTEMVLGGEPWIMSYWTANTGHDVFLQARYAPHTIRGTDVVDAIQSLNGQATPFGLLTVRRVSVRDFAHIVRANPLPLTAGGFINGSLAHEISVDHLLPFTHSDAPCHRMWEEAVKEQAAQRTRWSQQGWRCTKTYPPLFFKHVSDLQNV